MERRKSKTKHSSNVTINLIKRKIRSIIQLHHVQLSDCLRCVFSLYQQDITREVLCERPIIYELIFCTGVKGGDKQIQKVPYFCEKLDQYLAVKPQAENVNIRHKRSRSVIREMRKKPLASRIRTIKALLAIKI